jgi:catechol 2,3-dioxygenase-like lactoylglutathione lyase family enzyme
VAKSRRGKATMTETPAQTASRTTLLTAQPQLFCADLQATCDFFTQKLGFAITAAYGDPRFWAQVVRDCAQVNLRHTDGPVFHPDFRSQTEDALSATITVDNADALFAEFQSTGTPFHQTIRTEPWGASTFIVRDPDGNLILFAGG